MAKKSKNTKAPQSFWKTYVPTKNHIHTVNPEDSEKEFQFIIGGSKTTEEKEEDKPEKQIKQ